MTLYEAQRKRQSARGAALQQLEGILAYIITQPAGSVAWHGTTRDLIELVSLVGRQHLLVDSLGRPYTQVALARLAFKATGLHMPKSFSSQVRLIRNRANPNLSLLERAVKTQLKLF